MDVKEQEFSRMVREHKSTIYTVCYMFSNDADEVSDLFQETLINLWKGFESFRNESKLSTWIYRVAMNTCISADRKKRRQGSKVPLSMNINLYDDEDHETRQVRQLHERIQRLDLIDRALVMMWLEGMSYEEIADVVGISVKNVGVKLIRIKEKLKQK
ncbi:MAG: RNA polymerase sigma factor [Bacteroidaceae bacterium]|jgi:RNA polymerase sigma-70 factor (ECF subfamily)|nr:RNA polymerase sigma factor [Bacteroidaceae bacterium]